MKLTTVLGRLGEECAAEFLKKKGYIIIEKNYSCYSGEIDIIAKHKDCYVFVEVRERQNINFGHPLETIGADKIRKLVRTAQTYMKHKKLYDVAARFDVVSITGSTVELYPNAFEVN